MKTTPSAEFFDVLVIGSGGGVKLALPAANMGLRTALIEEDAVGGTCLNRGCIPSKMLILPAELADACRHSGHLNVHGGEQVSLDMPALITRTNRTVDNISANLTRSFAEHTHLELIRGHGMFTDNHTVQVGERRLSAKKIFIATGSRPALPAIAGLESVPYMTSREALRCTKLPQSLLVIGAGYIAVELGYAFAVAGCDVQFVVRSRLLRQEDEEIAAAFATAFSRRHTLHQGLQPIAVRHDHHGIHLMCHTASGKEVTLQAEALLIATGVSPCTDQLGLEHTDIACEEQGYVKTDDFLRTTVPGVYALGDAAGRYLFRHTVNFEGEYLCRTAFAPGPHLPIYYGPVPHAIFSNPELAAVGAREQDLLASGTEYICGRAAYADSTPGMARGVEHGLVKILVERNSRRLLGAHILGPEASNMIHLFIVLMKTHGQLDDLLEMIFVHPALPEVARDAARNARDQLA